MVDEGDGHRGDHLQPGHTLALDELENGYRVEFLDHHVGAPDDRNDVRGAPAIYVKERHRIEVDVTVAAVERDRSVERMEVEVAVGQHDAFGVRRGPAGVKKFGDAVFVNPAIVNLAGLGAGEQLIVKLRVRPSRLRAAQRDEVFDGTVAVTQVFDLGMNSGSKKSTRGPASFRT